MVIIKVFVSFSSFTSVAAYAHRCFSHLLLLSIALTVYPQQESSYE